MNISSLQLEWLNEENKKLEKDKARRYLHFDPKISHLDLERGEVKDLLDPVAVKKRAFYPFIKRFDVSLKYKKKGTKRIRKKKVREISYASHYDALIYSWYGRKLNIIYEEIIRELGLSDVVIAYRKVGRKNNVHFAKEIIDFIKVQDSCVTLGFDIEKFFDTLDHRLLKDEWRKVVAREEPKNKYLSDDYYAIYRSMTKFNFVEREKLIQTLKSRGIKSKSGRYCTPERFRQLIVPIIQRNKNPWGIPQGAPISDVLSNIYMVPFDEAVFSKVKELKGMYRRYCDDIIVIIPAAAAPEIEEFIISEIGKRKLVINPSKTEKNEFINTNGKLSCKDLDTGKPSKLQYLGVEYDGRQLKLRHRGYTRFDTRMTRNIKSTMIWAKAHHGMVPKRRLYKNFTHSGKTTYLSYAARAGDILQAPEIIRQTSQRRAIKKLKKKIEKFRGRFL